MDHINLVQSEVLLSLPIKIIKHKEFHKVKNVAEHITIVPSKSKSDGSGNSEKEKVNFTILLTHNSSLVLIEKMGL